MLPKLLISLATSKILKYLHHNLRLQLLALVVELGFVDSCPVFTIKHGQFAAVALTRSGANKMWRKAWQAFITWRDRITQREHTKILSNQKKFETQLENAQLSAGQQIDRRIDQNLAGRDAKVKSIIKETVKSQSIKKEAIEFDQSLLECDLTSTETTAWQFSQPSSSSFSNPKRSRQPDYIDLRSPNTQKSKKQDSRQDNRGFVPHAKGYNFTFYFKKVSKNGFK